MKVILLFLILINLKAAGQIARQAEPVRVITGEVKQAGKFIAEFGYSVQDSDTLYRLTLRNMEYQYALDLISLFFRNEDGTVDQLYKYLTTPGEPLTVKLGETDLRIEHTRNGVELSTGKGYCTLSTKQVKKLFAK